ncbi:MAG TPA: ribbon-helix-helix domain-containing protein [Polyangiaceae bacterium]|jgi:predicted transcriptional regulator
MGQTITIRLTKELASWLEQTAKRTGIPQGRIVREQLERVRNATPNRPFMKLAGIARGAADLSQRKGFSRK